MTFCDKWREADSAIWRVAVSDDDPFLGRRLSQVGELLVCSACLLGVYLHSVAELAV